MWQFFSVNNGNSIVTSVVSVRGIIESFPNFMFKDSHLCPLSE